MPPVSKIQSQAEAREYVIEQEALKLRAARQAMVNVRQAESIPTVKARVLPMGDGKVSTGYHAAPYGDAFFEKGEVIPDVPEDIAQALENKGYVEILPA